MSQDSPPVPDYGTRIGLGCALLILSPLIGAALALLQNANIEDAWVHCSGLAPEVANDIADTGQVWLGSLVLRAIGYSLCPPVGIIVGLWICRRRTRVVRVTVACALALVICALAFWGDYALNNGMTHGFYLPSLCPGGRPPWWPAWLPLRITGHR
ncbi:hypothetical protein [Actinoallomurus sp. CA-142502]|uniref:hypothetical protein n=1 Tax=Actinoallomurus sp. CA-142502 TaxID=3239885 RepID=UPI003D8BD0A3